MEKIKKVALSLREYLGTSKIPLWLGYVNLFLFTVIFFGYLLFVAGVLKGFKEEFSFFVLIALGFLFAENVWLLAFDYKAFRKRED